MRAREDIEVLIPHRGAMCLLERVLEWDAERVVLATRTHCSLYHPLRVNGRLRAIHLCEYGAQAMAVHGGLVARAQGKTAQLGWLVALREVRLNIDFIEALSGELIVSAQRLLTSATSWQYAFDVRYEERSLATGRAAVMARSA